MCPFGPALKSCAPKGLLFYNTLLHFPAIGTTRQICIQGTFSSQATRESRNQAKASCQPTRRPRRGARHTSGTSMHCPSQSHAKPGRAGPGSLYLDSSGKAPTEFWSEELEEAGNETVRPSSPPAAAPGHGRGPPRSLARKAAVCAPAGQARSQAGPGSPAASCQAAKPSRGSRWQQRLVSFQAAGATGIPEEASPCLATRLPRPGHGPRPPEQLLAGEGTRGEGSLQASSGMFPFLLKCWTAGRDTGIWLKAFGRDDDQILCSQHGTWHSMILRKGGPGHGLEQLTHQAGCCSFIFQGRCWGPRGEGPSEDAQGSEEGHSGLGYSYAPK